MQLILYIAQNSSKLKHLSTFLCTLCHFDDHSNPHDSHSLCAFVPMPEANYGDGEWVGHAECFGIFSPVSNERTRTRTRGRFQMRRWEKQLIGGWRRESRLSDWLTGFCTARGRIPAVGAFGSVGSFLFLATESSFQSAGHAIWLICQSYSNWPIMWLS